jgi:hypothetical protein
VDTHIASGSADCVLAGGAAGIGIGRPAELTVSLLDLLSSSAIIHSGMCPPEIAPDAGRMQPRTAQGNNNRLNRAKKSQAQKDKLNHRLLICAALISPAPKR